MVRRPSTERSLPTRLACRSSILQPAARMRRRFVRPKHLLIEVDDRAGDQAGFLTGEIGDSARNFGWLDETAERLLPLRFFQPVRIRRVIAQLDGVLAGGIHPAD